MHPLLKKMIVKAHQALAYSYAPYSQFHVASCIATDKNNVYVGVNVENSSFGLTICAESTAITSMVASGETYIQNMVILAQNNLLCTPCGACRQRIDEFSDSKTLIHLCNQDTVLKTLSMDELLPLAFKLNRPDHH